MTLPDSVTLRSATVDDARTLGAFRIAMLRDMLAGDEARLGELEVSQMPWIVEHLGNGSLMGLVAEHDGAPVGGVQVRIEPRIPSLRSPNGLQAGIYGLYVVPEHRRRGIARALVGRALELASDGGASVATLHASDAGRPLYESLGFAPTNEMSLGLAGAPGGPDTIR